MLSKERHQTVTGPVLVELFAKFDCDRDRQLSLFKLLVFIGFVSDPEYRGDLALRVAQLAAHAEHPLANRDQYR